MLSTFCADAANKAFGEVSLELQACQSVIERKTNKMVQIKGEAKRLQPLRATANLMEEKDRYAPISPPPNLRNP